MAISKNQFEATIQLKETCSDLIDEANHLLEITPQLVRDERFIKKLYCPHCYRNTGNFITEFVCYGFVAGTDWQRYECKQCNRIFSDLTNTMFHRSRNMKIWPRFIQLLMVENRSMKEIACILRIHINTAYTWRKKLRAFSEQILPNKQHPPMNNDTMDTTVVHINRSNKGNTSPKAKELTSQLYEDYQEAITVFIAIVRESPNQISANVLLKKDALIHYDTHSYASTGLIQREATAFLEYYSGMRGVSTRNLSQYLTWYRMLRLLNALNPQLLAIEMFKICLNRDTLSLSKRLIKKLI
jgi:transposase-like protein